MLKKSLSPSVSKMEETVCLAIVSLRPFMLPLTSTRITTSLGDVAAWMYLQHEIKLNTSTQHHSNERTSQIYIISPPFSWKWNILTHEHLPLPISAVEAD